ncbi:MAG: diguanylate cyclase [Nitrospiraceae bacterium]|nr:MAG: diguanylate cyclase [Nitrospiraceae bacterium]
MKDSKKTKEQLIIELNALRQENEQLNKQQDEHKREEKAIQDSEEKFRSLVESSDDSIYLVDKGCKYLFMNRNHLTRMNLGGREYSELTYDDVHTPEESRVFRQKVQKTIDARESLQFEYKSKRNKRYFFQTFSPVLDQAGGIEAIMVVSKDITRLKEIEDQQRTLSVTDELTGFYNRRGFYALAEMQINLADRLGNGMYLLYADLDNLKTINDTHGHQEGDRAIIEVSKIIDENYRRSDVIARIGGDEFVILPVGDSRDSVEMISARLQNVLKQYNEKSLLDYELSLSIGIAYYDPQNPCTVDELLDRADKCMYEEKKLKRSS